MGATGGGAGGGRSRATIGESKPTFLWLPSQKGLSWEWPQRQRLTAVRPLSPKTRPSMSHISSSPSTRSGPLLLTVIFVVANVLSSLNPNS